MPVVSATPVSHISLCVFLLRVGLWSNVMFSWVGPMVRAAQGGHKIHPQHDVPPVIDTDTAR
jgi:hypothetical protein